MLQEKKEFESNINDPSRLLTRGGAAARRLLEEEKTRKKLQKDIPLITNKLRKMLTDWQEERGTPFLFEGAIQHYFK